MAPRIFLYKYIIFSQLRIWLPGSAAGRLCEYRLIEPACSCSESVLIEPVAHFHFCSSKLGFTRGIDGLVAPSLAACDSLFGPVVDVPALEGLTRLCHLCYGCCLISVVGCMVACMWPCCPVSSSSRDEVTILFLAGTHQPLCASTVPLSLLPSPFIAPSRTHFLISMMFS